MECLLRLIQAHTGASLRWHDRPFYATVASIAALPPGLRRRLTGLCMPHGREHLWRAMLDAMAWFGELAEEVGLLEDTRYPHRAQTELPGYARFVEGSTRSITGDHPPG